MVSIRQDRQTGGAFWGQTLRINRPDEEAADPVSTAQSEARLTADTVTLGYVNDAISTASDALRTITELRRRQLALADEAQNSAQGERLIDLNTELQSLQEEITRVAAAATYNGQNVLEGGLYSSPDGQEENAYAIGVADTTALAADLNISITTPASAASAYEAIEASLSSAYAAGSGLGAALDKGVQAAEASKAEPQETLATLGQAENLAASVKEDINELVSSGQRLQQQIDIALLNPDKVKELLDEDDKPHDWQA